MSRTTPSLSGVLRVGPNHGRWFTEGEGEPGAAPVAVLSHGLWLRRYGQDPGVLGRRLTLDGVPMTIVGVMPSSFAFPDPRVDLWIPDPVSRPMATSAAAAGVYDFSGVARMREGATIADVRAELTRLAVELAPGYPGQGFDRLVSTATTLLDANVGRIAATLGRAGVGGMVFSCARTSRTCFSCATEAKQRERPCAARSARRRRHRGLFLAESAWLAAAGGALGLALAWARSISWWLGPAALPRLRIYVRRDGDRVRARAEHRGRSDVRTPLRLGPPRCRCTSGRGTPSRGRHRIRQILMAGQVRWRSCSCRPASAAQLSEAAQRRSVDAASTHLPRRIAAPTYQNRDAMVAAHRAILDRLSALSGVTAISAATCLPLSEQGCLVGPLFVEGRVLPPDANAPPVRNAGVAGAYFETMRTRIVRGRGIDRGDVERGELVAVVNEALANIVFPQQDPIGRRVRLGNPSRSTNPGWLAIVGVAGNTSYRALGEAAAVPILYTPISATRALNIVPPAGAMSYVIRAAVAPQALTEPARRAVGEIDASLALAQVRTLEEMLDRASAQMAFTMILLLIAAAVALVLGAIGIYGVTSYIVSQRTGEIGVRLALGARPASVVALIVRQGGVVAIVGILAGLGSAFAGGRLIESLLYGIGPRDPAVLVVTTLVLLTIALLACSLPARRAARLNPADALRAD